VIFPAGPHLTTNCLTDHRTWYNLQVSRSGHRCLCYTVKIVPTRHLQSTSSMLTGTTITIWNLLTEHLSFSITFRISLMDPSLMLIGSMVTSTSRQRNGLASVAFLVSTLMHCYVPLTKVSRNTSQLASDGAIQCRSRSTLSTEL
jgi:hypothetical protein